MLQRPRSFYLIGPPVESVSEVADVLYDVLSQMHDTRLEGFQVSQTAGPLPCIDKWMSESVTHQRLIGLGCTVQNFGVCRRHGHGHNCVDLLLLLWYKILTTSRCQVRIARRTCLRLRRFLFPRALTVPCLREVYSDGILCPWSRGNRDIVGDLYPSMSPIA